MIHIDALDTKGLDCREACHILLCNFYRKEYEASFYDIFNFCFDQAPYRETGELGSCLNWPVSIVDNISQIYNLKIEGEFLPKIEALKNIQLLLKQGIPVIIESSTMCCPWLKQYKVIDNPRYLVVYGGGVTFLEVIDTTLDIQKHKRLYNYNLPSQMLRYGTMTLTPYKQDCKKTGYRMIQHLKNLSIDQCFDDCSEVLQRINNFNNEFSTESFYPWSSNTDIFFGQRLPNSCRYFADFLKYLEKYLYHSKMFYNECLTLDYLGKRWKMFRNLLFRCKLYGSIQSTSREALRLLLDEIQRLYHTIIDSLLKKV